MKELTIKKETLDVVRQMVADGQVSQEVAEKYFPELRESENERIRKEIINFLELPHPQFVGKRDHEKWIAWLEKQKNCEYIRKDWLEHIKQSWYKEGFIDGKYTPKELTINDATTLNGLIDFLENGTAKLQHDLTLYANWLKTQFSPIEKQGEQNLNWGEEDEERFQSCIKILQTSDGYDTINTKWLKSLKDRVQPQPKQKWTEEDETGFGDALWAIKQAKTIAKDENDMGNLWYAERWLKNLVEKIKG